jgi:hypothetical protein
MSCDPSEYTIADVEADLLANADFEEVGSVSKAKAFVTAAKRWLIMRPNTAAHQGNSLSLNADIVKEMMDRAQNFIAVNNTGASGNVLFLGVNGFTRWD